MEPRIKKLSSQLGKSISHIGAHMPSAVVGIIRKRRSKQHRVNAKSEVTGSTKPVKADDPYPLESM